MSVMQAKSEEELDVLKVGYQTHSLHVVDIDGQGAKGIVLANRNSGTVDIFYSILGSGSDERNKIESNFIDFNENWKLKSIPVDRDIYALRVADINGDGLKDIVYHGKPENLMVLLQKKEGQFGSPLEIELAEGLNEANGLNIRKIDGCSEVVIQHEEFRTHLLIDSKVKVILRKEFPVLKTSQGLFRSMEWLKIPPFKEGLWVQVADERTPLLYYAHRELLSYDYPKRLVVPQTRMLVPGQFKGKESSFIQVRSLKGKLSQVKFVAENSLSKRVFSYERRSVPYAHTKSLDFSYSVVDINGDAEDDIVVAHRSTAQLEVFLQKDGELLPGAIFPSFRDVDFIVSKKEGLLMSSKTEGAQGHSDYIEGELRFPKIQKTEGKLVTSILSRSKEGGLLQLRKIKDKPYLIYGDKKLPINMEEPYPFKGMAANLTPSKYPELILEIPYQGLRFYTWSEDKKEYVNLLSEVSFLKEKTISNMSLNSIELISMGDHDEFSVSQKNMIRRYHFYTGAKIIEQVNLPRPAAESRLHAYLDLDGDGRLELVSYDQSSAKLDFFKRPSKDGNMKWVQSLPAPREGVEALLGFYRKGVPQLDLILASRGQLEWYQAGGKSIKADFIDLGLEDAQWQYSYGGAALKNTEGENEELCLLDSNRHYMDIFSWKEKMERNFSFPVYEDKGFSQGNNALGEVRDFVSVDLDGEGDPEIVVLIHDRILIYYR